MSDFLRLPRRTVLASLAGMAAMPFLSKGARAKPLAELTLFGPPAGPLITLAHAAAAGFLTAVADKVSVRAWRNPDEMRAGLTSATMPLVVMPTTSAANLFSRGLGIRLVNVLTDGLLYVVAADPALDAFEKLKGKRLAVPFRNDTPEYILNRLLRHYRLTAGTDLAVDMTGTPTEAIQLLLAGRIDAALVPEPAVSAVILRAAKAGKTMHRVIDIQKEWGKLTALGASLPQAGLAVTDKFLAENGPLVENLHAALVRSAASVRENPARAAADSAAALQMDPAMVEASIPHSNLVARRATEARSALEAMFKTVADENAAIIGGGLPAAEFYL